MIIANLSNLAWVGGRRRRNQSIFSHMLLETDGFEEGFFIQPPIFRSSRSFDLFAAPKLEVVSQPTECGRPVTVLQPAFSLPAGSPSPMALSRAASALAQKLIREQFQNRPFMLWINSISHFQGEIAKQLAPAARFRVFDSTDALMMYERNENAAQLKQKHLLLESADAVLCVNEHVMGRVAHPVKQIFPNCTEFGAFQRKDPAFQLAPLYPKPPGAVYIGFTGVLSGDLIDMDLLHALFTRFPQYQFVFVGETNRPSLLARLKTYANFHFMPEVGYEILPKIVQGFDAAIIPHLDSDYARGNDFNKVLDYLACGVPVVSTPSSNAEKYEDVIYVVNSVWEFGHVLERLATKNRPHDPVPGMALARRLSWAQKVPELVEWLWDQQLGAQRSHQPAGAELISLSGVYS